MLKVFAHWSQIFKRCMDGLSTTELLQLGDAFKQEAARRTGA